VSRSEQEFRDFIVGFADPLCRLAFLLTAGTAVDPIAATEQALARVRRQWRDAEDTGAPETLAIDALVFVLPRGQHRPPADAVPAEPAPGDAVEDDDSIDAAVLRGAAWTAWTALEPRQRVPFLFDDPAVASRRLAGLAGDRTSRRAERVAEGAWDSFRAGFSSDRSVGRRAESLSDSQIAALLRDALREHAAAVPAPIEPYPRVVERVRRMRVRAGTSVAAVLVVVGAVGALAVNASTQHNAASGTGGLPLTSPTPGTPLTPGSAPPAPTSSAPPASTALASPVVAGVMVTWPTRGTAAGDSTLLASLKTAFHDAHPDTTGPAQVLLATDTSAYRIACVTADSPNGVLQSWFYGPVGSNHLVEGVVQYDDSLTASSVVATGLADSRGDTQLVVIAPPGTTTMQVANNDLFDSTPWPYQPLPNIDGVAVKGVATGSVAALKLDVKVGATDVVNDQMRTLALGPPFEGASAPFEPQAAPSFPVERGQPDPQVLAQAANNAGVWALEDGPANRVQMKVLWGGTDQAGNRIVAVRMKMDLSDLLLVTWETQRDVVAQEGEDLAAPSAPDAPITFIYAGVDNYLVGVLGAPGQRGAALDFNGKRLPAVNLDATGFASLALADDNWLKTAGLGVDLFDAAGHVVARIAVPPQ
jgi:hypothetical protein